MNHTKINGAYQKEVEKRKPKALFGKKESEENVTNVGDMVDLLHKFDAVVTENDATTKQVKIKEKEKRIKEKENPIIDSPHRNFLPVTQFSLTKTDTYKAHSHIDNHLIPPGRSIRFSHKGKVDKLLEYQNEIQRELVLNNCPLKGPDLRRLRIYSNIFEKIIQEFTTYGPLLAEIKVS